MALRVTDANVKALIDTDITDTTTIYVTAANALVTDLLGSSGLSAQRLKDIEMWLSAHLVSMGLEDGGRLVKESIGGYSAEFVNAFGTGLKHTRYGQMVLSLDTTGKFSALATTKARFTIM